MRQNLEMMSNQQAIRESNLGLANVLYDRLMTQIADFEENLSAEEEIGGYLAAFGREILIRIEHVGYHNPYFITFSGWDLHTGARVRLVQHTTQIGVLLTAVPKAPEHVEPRRIGFVNDESAR